MKEVLEETGIECEPVRLIAVLDGLRLGFAPGPDVLDRVPLPDDRRRAAAATRSRPRRSASSPRDALPQPLAGAHRWLDLAFAAIDGEELEAWYDEPRDPPWRGE